MKAAFAFIVAAVLSACNSRQAQTGHIPTIDSTLQAQTEIILQQKLTEIGATKGQVIVMEVQTGDVKAMAGSAFTPQESGLVRTASLLAALETGKIRLADTVNVGNGICVVGNDTVHDYNWRRGGYGELTVEKSFGKSSNVASYKISEKAFGDGQAFAKALAKYGYQVKDISLAYNPSGYGILTTPLQNLTFYNAIAKGTIAKGTGIGEALEYTVAEGLGKPAMSDKVRVAGATGTIRLSGNEYAAEFCGYVPADNPRYSIIVSINKQGFPVSGGLMAGSVFKEIVNLLWND